MIPNSVDFITDLDLNGLCDPDSIICDPDQKPVIPDLTSMSRPWKIPSTKMTMVSWLNKNTSLWQLSISLNFQSLLNDPKYNSVTTLNK